MDDFYSSASDDEDGGLKDVHTGHGGERGVPLDLSGRPIPQSYDSDSD